MSESTAGQVWAAMGRKIEPFKSSQGMIAKNVVRRIVVCDGVTVCQACLLAHRLAVTKDCLCY